MQRASVLLAGPLAILAGVACGSGSDTEQPPPVADAGLPPAQDGAAPPGDGATPITPDGGATPDSGPGPVNPNPTVSSWLGTNADADLTNADVTYMLSPFDTAAAQKDGDGYPLAGASGTSSTDVGFELPTGTYKVSFVGDGTVDVSGIGKLGAAWQTVNGEQRNTIAITGTPGAFGNFLTVKVTNGPGQTVKSLHILVPGLDYDTTTVFVPQYLALLGPFRAIRFMGWQATNNSTLADWADRPKSSSFGRSAFGEPYEHMIELVNETGKDAWINVPEHATTDFIAQLAAFCAQKLDFARIQAARNAAGFTTPFQLIVENSNETWNGGFTAYATFLAAAGADTARFTGTFTGTYGPTWMSQNANLMKVAQYEADRLVQIGNAFRTAMQTVGHADAVAPVLSGWALGAAYSDEGLSFVQSTYGDPSKYVSYVAMAPYFATPDDTTTGALDTLFTALETNISGMDATFGDFAKMAAHYNVKMAAYEGGQGLSGATNQTTKHLAQHDERMYEAYKAYMTLWKKDFGESLFMHFVLAGTPGLPENIYQYGFWGSIIGVMEDPKTCAPNLPTLTGTESIASVVHHCPKYRALMEAVPR